jgi:hypothetical protein
MIWFVGGSMRIWKSQLALQLPRPRFYRKKNKAICWFKHTASEHLARVRELAAILDNHGVPVRTLKAKRVGYVVYEDEYQIVAEPFADTEC